MNVLVRGKNCRVPRGVRESAEEKLARLTRLAPDADRAEVEFSETGQHHSPPTTSCEVTVHLRRGIVRAHAASSDASSALDRTIDKAEHQLAKIKGKRVTRAHGRRDRDNNARVEATSSGRSAPMSEADDQSELHIVREKRFDVKPMSPEEAALQMDLLGHDFFLFSNSENGNAAVLYRRRDGDLGLIETVG